uniref:Uncharacterized protein n=1 Tax=Glossina palpalis gambiensis TaxID=67801 RepID=A0A1B0BSV3_9MUSC
MIFLLILAAYKDLCVRREDKKLGDTEGHYTAHIGVATNDPCTIPGPKGANYYLKWNHGKLLGAVERPTYKKCLIPPLAEDYTETPKPVTMSPQPGPKTKAVAPSQEAGPMIIPAPQGREAVIVAPIQGPEAVTGAPVQGPQAVTVAPIQAPEVVTTAPIQST